MPDETLYIDRRFPAILLAIALGFILAGLLIGGDMKWGLIISGIAFVPICVPVFWVKIATLRADHLQIGKRRIPYSQIARIDGQSDFAHDVAASVTGRHTRQQDYLEVHVHTEDAPLRIPVTFYRDGADGLARKIMSRVAG